jgi:hypothetical protein
MSFHSCHVFPISTLTMSTHHVYVLMFSHVTTSQITNSLVHTCHVHSPRHILMSSHDTTSHVMSTHIMSCHHAFSCISNHVTTFHVFSCLFTSSPFMSPPLIPLISCPLMPCLTVSRPLIPSPHGHSCLDHLSTVFVISCHLLSCHPLVILCLVLGHVHSYHVMFS